MGRKDLRLLIPVLTLCAASGVTLWLCGRLGIVISAWTSALCGAGSIGILLAITLLVPFSIRRRSRKQVGGMNIRRHTVGADASWCESGQLSRPSWPFTLTTALVAALVGAASALGHYGVRYPPDVMQVFSRGGEIEAVGTVKKMNDQGATCIGEMALMQILSASGATSKGESVGQATREGLIRGRPVVSAEMDCRLAVGQEIRFRARPRPAFKHGTVAHVVIKEADVTGEGSLTARVRLHFLRATAAVLDHFSLHAQGLIPGAALGEESMLDARSEMDMKTSGLTHLIAVSGGHIALVLTVCLALIGRRRNVLSALSCVIVLAGLCVLVGLEASVVRALMMAVPIVIAIAARLPAYSSICLAVSALVCFLFAPFTATSLGFLLSWVASAGIIFVAPRVTAALSYFTASNIAALIAVPLVASVATLPLQLLLNPQASLWQVVANILAAPVVAPLTIFGLVGVLLAVWAPSLASVVFIPASWCTWWITAMAARLSSLVGSHLPTVAVWAVYLTLLAALVIAGRHLDRKYHPASSAHVPW